MSSTTWAVVVSRTGPDAKSRLANILDPATRSALAVAMLTDVLRALKEAKLGGIAAVLAPSVALADGFVPVPDPGNGLNAAVAAGVRAAINAGAGTVLVVPGDLPLLSPDDVAALLSAAQGERAVVVAPDRHGTGTNALVLRPGDVISPAFGPDSGARHLAAAHKASAAAASMSLDRVALDLDTPEDLRELLQRRVAGETGAVLRTVSASTVPR